MKKLLLVIFIMISTLSGWSQTESTDDFSISINGNIINPSADFNQQFDQLSRSNKQARIPEYKIIQFTKIPSLKEQQKLKEQGVILLNYLSNKAYYALIKPDFYFQLQNFNNKISFNKAVIRSIISLNPKYKLDPLLGNAVIPDYALEDNFIKVVITYFKGTDKEIISNELAKFFVKNIKIIDSFNQIYLQVSKDKIEEIATLNWVQNIELISPPVESDNLPGLTSHKANILNSNIPGLGYGLTGNGVKVGIWDGNLEKHKDHTERVINKEYEYYSSHGEHVSGTLGGAGLLDPKAKGMAPKVQMYGWNFNTQSNLLPVYAEREISANEDGIELTSNSYGINLTSGYNTVRYGVLDRGDDEVTVKYPYLLNVYSNGNSQTAYPGGYNTSTKCSKNGLYVAANNPNDLMSSYSSFGPTIDGRLVPQISAVGTNVYSLDYNNSYQVMSGTSMATPGVTGTLALLYERYKNTYKVKPLASLMKALVCNTAKDIGNPGPDYKYGFGNLNALRAIKALDNKMFYMDSIANNESYEKIITVPAGLVSLKVMLAYSDIQATPGASSIQINNLDIKIMKDGKTILPWVLNPIQPATNAKRGVDNLNNIEQITLDNPTAGTYTIIVTGKNIPYGHQKFSVVYDYVAPELILTYPIGGEKFDPDSTEYIRWDYEGVPKTFTLEYSIDGGINYSIIAKDISSTTRNFAWRVPSRIVANAKIRISAGTMVDTSKEIFHIITEPKNLKIDPATCGIKSYTMSWDPILGAKYEVLKLNRYTFDVVATVNNPNYTFDNLKKEDDYWFSVRAIDIATNIVSERVKAVNVVPIIRPIQSAADLPFTEDFSKKIAKGYILSRGTTGTIGYSFANTIGTLNGFPNQSDVLKMAGSREIAAAPWIVSTTTNAFDNNPEYIKKLTFCNIDASKLSGKSLRMEFKLIWNNVGGAINKSFFRVLVDGNPVSSHENITVYGGTQSSGATTLLYDLSAYTKKTLKDKIFRITLESVIDNDVVVVNNEDVFNSVVIDDIKIYEAKKTDLALSSFIPNTSFTNEEIVKVKIYNYSPVAIKNIPVSYRINGTEVLEKIPGPINPLSEINYNFTKKADFSSEGVYNVVGKINYTGDDNADNDRIIKKVINPGTTILMGSSALITTCNASFMDSGFSSNYDDNLTEIMTFKPDKTGNKITVNFTSLELENNKDFLYIYNGPTISSPLLATYTGTPSIDSMQPLISTAAGGELTFKFTSDSEINKAGWVANIECVDLQERPKIVDASITSIITPEALGKKTNTNDITIKINNLSSVALTNYPVYYQINNGVKITDIVPNIPPNSSVSFTFTTKADLSNPPNSNFIITCGLNIENDNPSNILSKTVNNNNDLPSHTNTDGFAISRLKWNDIINNSEISAYSDFKNIKIPVYAGFTYQPEVKVVKPGAPITRDLSSSVAGLFTMIVIDLNGDGNLTDEFYAGNFWVNTLNTSGSPAIPSTPTTHYFRNHSTLVGGLTIPANTASGEKLMRVIHMFRSTNEYYNVNLGPTRDGLTTSREDFEIEEYTINVLPFTAADASIERILGPIKPSNNPVVVSAVIRNYSNVAISNFPIAYMINGQSEVQETYTASIPARGTATYSFTNRTNLSQAGDYIINVYTKLGGDLDRSNDLKSITISHAANEITGADDTKNYTGTFDGINDFIKTDSNPALNLTNNYTFEAWMNQKEATVFGRILDKTNILVFVHNNDNLASYKENSLVISITTATGGSYTMNTDVNSIQKNKWYHIAYTVDTTNNYIIYINGVAANFTATGTKAAAATNSANPIYIGNNSSLARGFNGNIDEVRIWSKALSEADIINNMTKMYDRNKNGLVGYYSFSEGDKQFVFDSSSNDNTAIINNANTNGLGEGKFWNIPILLQSLEFENQLSSSYDSATKTYTILLNNEASVQNAKINFSLGMNSIAKINGIVQESGVTTNDYTTPVTFEVEGVGFNVGILETYTLKVLYGLKTESQLLQYNFRQSENSISQDINTTINGNNITAIVPSSYDLSNLKASFSISPGAELLIDGVKQNDFLTSPLDYTTNRIISVVSEDKLSQTNYVISLMMNDNAFINYSVPNQIGTSNINYKNHTINVLVNNSAILKALIPQFEVSQGAIVKIGKKLQISNVTKLIYKEPVVYSVIANDNTIINWTIKIRRAKPTITLIGDAIVSINNGCTYREAGCEAKDNLNNKIKFVRTGNVNINVSGQYILTYTATDKLNNKSSVTRVVNVLTTQCDNLLENYSFDKTQLVEEKPINDVISGFEFYPNPIKDNKIYVITATNHIKNIKIFNSSGKNVFSINTINEELIIPNLPSGLYIIELEQDGHISSKKMIVE